MIQHLMRTISYDTFITRGGSPTATLKDSLIFNLFIDKKKNFYPTIIQNPYHYIRCEESTIIFPLYLKNESVRISQTPDVIKRVCTCYGMDLNKLYNIEVTYYFSRGMLFDSDFKPLMMLGWWIDPNAVTSHFDWEQCCFPTAYLHPRLYSNDDKISKYIRNNLLKYFAEKGNGYKLGSDNMRRSVDARVVIEDFDYMFMTPRNMDNAEVNDKELNFILNNYEYQ